MNFGKALSFISPLGGMLSGNGAGFLPYLSPGFGLLSGKGPFGKDDDEEERLKRLLMASQAPTGMFGAGMFGGGR